MGIGRDTVGIIRFLGAARGKVSGRGRSLPSTARICRRHRRRSSTCIHSSSSTRIHSRSFGSIRSSASSGRSIGQMITGIGYTQYLSRRRSVNDLLCSHTIFLRTILPKIIGPSCIFTYLIPFWIGSGERNGCS